jgi:hypothetical protein
MLALVIFSIIYEVLVGTGFTEFELPVVAGVLPPPALELGHACDGPLLRIANMSEGHSLARAPEQTCDARGVIQRPLRGG